MNKTGIEYLDLTWNPIAMRCTRVSPGCDHCWHLKMCYRHAGNPKLTTEMREARGGGSPVLLEDELQAPTRRKKSAIIGVEFMGDLFHADITREMRGRVIEEITINKRHTFLILTKRPRVALNEGWVFPDNVGVGVSVESADYLDRIETLSCISAAWRFVSFEPLLGPIEDIPAPIDWMAVGAETGPGARRMELEWARILRDIAQGKHIPFFFKSAGPGIETPDDLKVQEWPSETV